MNQYACTAVEPLADDDPERTADNSGGRLIFAGFSDIEAEIDQSAAAFLVANIASADIALMCVLDIDGKLRVVAWATIGLVGAATEWIVSRYEFATLVQAVPVVRASKRGASEVDVFAAIFAFDENPDESPEEDRENGN